MYNCSTPQYTLHTTEKYYKAVATSEPTLPQTRNTEKMTDSNSTTNPLINTTRSFILDAIQSCNNTESIEYLKLIQEKLEEAK